jgi:hypothetical protein
MVFQPGQCLVIVDASLWLVAVGPILLLMRYGGGVLGAVLVLVSC